MIPTLALGGLLSLSKSGGGGGPGGGGGGHRYWRITNITTGALLEISELQLWFGGANVNGDATQTSSDVPAFNPLSALFDGLLTSRCYWPDSTVETGTSFWIKWDFGSNQEIDGFKQGGFDTSGRHITDCELQYSDNDADWTTAQTFSGLTYPGNNTLSSLYSI